MNLGLGRRRHSSNDSYLAKGNNDSHQHGSQKYATG